MRLHFVRIPEPERYLPRTKGVTLVEVHENGWLTLLASCSFKVLACYGENTCTELRSKPIEAEDLVPWLL